MTSEHCVIRARFLYTKISFFCVFLPTSGKDSGADSDSRFLSCTDKSGSMQWESESESVPESVSVNVNEP